MYADEQVDLSTYHCLMLYLLGLVGFDGALHVLEHTLDLFTLPLHLIGSNIGSRWVSLDPWADIDDNEGGVIAILQE